MMSLFSRSPAIFKFLERTMPPKEITAILVVPPPMSIIMEPTASLMGKRMPMAAAIGSEIREHLFRNLKVGYHSVHQRPNCFNMAWGSAQHVLGFDTYRQNLTGFNIDRHHRGLVDDNAVAFEINQSVGGAQVYADVVGNIIVKFI